MPLPLRRPNLKEKTISPVSLLDQPTPPILFLPPPHPIQIPFSLPTRSRTTFLRTTKNPKNPRRETDFQSIDRSIDRQFFDENCQNCPHPEANIFNCNIFSGETESALTKVKEGGRGRGEEGGTKRDARRKRCCYVIKLRIVRGGLIVLAARFSRSARETIVQYSH